MAIGVVEAPPLIITDAPAPPWPAASTPAGDNAAWGTDSAFCVTCTTREVLISPIQANTTVSPIPTPWSWISLPTASAWQIASSSTTTRERPGVRTVVVSFQNTLTGDNEAVFWAALGLEAAITRRVASATRAARLNPAP